MKVQGFRFGSFAYVTDIKTYTDQIFEDLKGVETLVLSALRFTPSPMHFSIDDAIDFVSKVSPTRAYLTHIAHELDHEKTNAYLPPNMKLAYDGLKLNL
jgi:phosphoribosyl 1,2-cyclic phosphate phosphodiesterase